MERAKIEPQSHNEYDYDVVEMADCRLPGGSVHSTAEEIRAQSSAGYTTGIFPVYGSISKRFAPFSPVIQKVVTDGCCTVITPLERSIRVKIAILRNPTQFMDTKALTQKIAADIVIMVVNHQPQDGDGKVNYDPIKVNHNLQKFFGVEPIWSPIGPAVRKMLSPFANKIKLTDYDWVNVIDLNSWVSPRKGLLGSKPIIGRHSRDAKLKWPADARTLRMAYPESNDITVNILGGAKFARDLLGDIPHNWIVHPFGSIKPKDYLESIDFWVYFHHPDLNEAYGRAAMEALASGAVAIMPHHFKLSFNNSGVIFANPEEVEDIVTRLHSNKDLYLEHSRLSQSFAQQYSWSAHETRLKRLIGEPSNSKPAIKSVKTTGAKQPNKEVVMFVLADYKDIRPDEIDKLSSQMDALAKVASPIIVTTSKDLVRSMPKSNIVYISSHHEVGSNYLTWSKLFTGRLIDHLDIIKPSSTYIHGVDEQTIDSLRHRFDNLSIRSISDPINVRDNQLGLADGHLKKVIKRIVLAYS